MHHINLKLILIACLIGIVTCGSSFADESIEIVRANGRVVIKQDNQEEQPVVARSILPARHVLVTGSNGRAVVRVGEDGYMIIEENSRVEIDRENGHSNFFRHVTGMIYYAMNALRASRRPTEIRTDAALLGIRGTRFLVADLPDRKEVGVRKGLVSITSPGEDFEIHRQTQEDEFRAFKREGREAIADEKRQFSEYKATAEREFIEYKREFGLGENRMATFDGNRVVERSLSDESRKEMETLEAYGKEWLEQVRD